MRTTFIKAYSVPAVGTAVFAGMNGVTFFGLLLTPVFYVALGRLARRR